MRGYVMPKVMQAVSSGSGIPTQEVSLRSHSRPLCNTASTNRETVAAGVTGGSRDGLLGVQDKFC